VGHLASLKLLDHGWEESKSAECKEGCKVSRTVDGIDDGSVKDNLAVVQIGAAVLIGHNVLYVETV